MFLLKKKKIKFIMAKQVTIIAMELPISAGFIFRSNANEQPRHKPSIRVYKNKSVKGVPVFVTHRMDLVIIMAANSITVIAKSVFLFRTISIINGHIR